MTYVVYRCFDSSDVLLYVGSTSRLSLRKHEHAQRKSWWSQVAAITTEEHPDRETAFAAETAAIRVERPVHNKAQIATGRVPCLNRKARMVNLNNHDWDDLVAVAEERDLSAGWILRHLLAWWLGREGAEMPERPVPPKRR